MSELSDKLHEVSSELVQRSRNVLSPKKAEGYLECIKYINSVAQSEQWASAELCKCGHALNKSGSFCMYCGLKRDQP